MARRDRRMPSLAPADTPLRSSARCRWKPPKVDVDDGFPRHSIALLRQRGLLAAPVPREHRGAGLGGAGHRLTLLQVLARLGRGSLDARCKGGGELFAEVGEQVAESDSGDVPPV